MEKPTHILKASEPAWEPKPNSSVLTMVKKGIRIVLVVLLIGSLVFQDNLFAEMSQMPRVLLIGLFCGTFFMKDKEKVAKPFEIRFYDDSLVLYRERRYYSPKLTRMEFDKFMFKDIKKIQYRTKTKRINIYGLVEGEWYNYNKDGSLPEKPSYHKTTDSIAYFYTSVATNVDFVAEIEKYTPIKVTIENN